MEDPVGKPIFEGYEPVQEWFREKQPDVLVYIYNDHMTAFFDHYSTLRAGGRRGFGPADEGGGPRAIPAIKGDPEFAAHVARVMVANEFDLSYFQGKDLDLRGVLAAVGRWSTTTTRAGRCKLLLVVVRRADRAAARARALLEVRARRCARRSSRTPQDIKVAIAGTGGLSHQVHGEGCRASTTASGTWSSWTGLEKDPEKPARLHRGRA